MKQAKTRTRDKPARAMEHLNGEKLSYGPRRWKGYGMRSAHFRRYNCGLENEPAATLENHGRDPYNLQ